MSTLDQHPAPAGERTEPAPALLRRSREDRVLFGVCGGLGRYFGIDPTIVRIAAVLLAIFGGSGVLLYLIGLVAIPAERPGEAMQAGTATAPNGAAVALGAVLVAVGSVLLVGRLVPAFSNLFGPLVLVALGVLVILVSRR